MLARLGPRLSLRGLGTAVLGFEPSAGDIVELYGGAGVGKTELLLHLASCAILPTCHHGDQTSSSTSPGQRHQRGNQTQVVWVDCDLKFSVLRLAVLLEQRIVKNEPSGQRRGQGRGEGHVCGEDGDADSGEEREVRTAGVGQNDPRLDNSVSTSTGCVCDMQRTCLLYTSDAADES